MFTTFKPIIIVLMLCTSLLQATTRIMPLGDSITYDNTHADAVNPRPAGLRTAYRSHLWYMLQDAGYDADFVGSLRAGQDVTPPFDPDNEGHPGWTSYDIANHVYDFLSTNPADVVLLHIGTNDYSTSVAGVNSILDEIDLFERESGRHVKVYVAMIIDRQVHDPVITIFNTRLMELVGRRYKNGDDLTLVDMYHLSHLDRSTDYFENTHPNSNGYRKMAKVWLDALMGPDTVGLYAFPYTVAHKSYVDLNSIHVDYNTNSVDFIAEVPDDGLTF